MWILPCWVFCIRKVLRVWVLWHCLHLLMNRVILVAWWRFDLPRVRMVVRLIVFVVFGWVVLISGFRFVVRWWRLVIVMRSRVGKVVCMCIWGILDWCLCCLRLILWWGCSNLLMRFGPFGRLRWKRVLWPRIGRILRVLSILRFIFMNLVCFHQLRWGFWFCSSMRLIHRIFQARLSIVVLYTFKRGWGTHLSSNTSFPRTSTHLSQLPSPQPASTPPNTSSSATRGLF